MRDDEARPDLGAFLLAVGRLDADLETAAKIARLFGIPIPEGPPPPAVVEPPVPPPVTPEVREPVRVGGTTETPSQVAPVEPSAAVAPAEGEEQQLVAVRTAGPSTVSPDVPRALPVATPWSAQNLPFMALIRPVASRAIIGSALAQRSAGGPIDIDQLVDLVARRQVVTDVPRLPRWSIAGRTLVLIDRGAGMAPFARDAGDLAERIAAVASRDRTEVRRFWRTPLRVGSSPTGATKMKPPPRGTVVVALTDLGIAPGAPFGLESDWLAFAAELGRAGCPLVIFVPYPASRWPARLAGLSIITWDRSTSLATVLATVHRRPLPVTPP